MSITVRIKFPLALRFFTITNTFFRQHFPPINIPIFKKINLNNNNKNKTKESKKEHQLTQIGGVFNYFPQIHPIYVSWTVSPAIKNHPLICQIPEKAPLNTATLMSSTIFHMYREYNKTSAPS